MLIRNNGTNHLMGIPMILSGKISETPRLAGRTGTHTCNRTEHPTASSSEIVGEAMLAFYRIFLVRTRGGKWCRLLLYEPEIWSQPD